ncbi:hypothetical protein EXIGLDRAFT_87190 [Exidia glandulosa HHB12029]|uniref:Uncharacterized protein n=1 Tax=Exidia glandulosa HHB12029 TaxID=1314781 RepID=A0A165HD77_EXIGL|nr:hypothetical protein EXIGLDRAFT_87190 [Exidia glandulosa HHB12029]
MTRSVFALSHSSCARATRHFRGGPCGPKSRIPKDPHIPTATRRLLTPARPVRRVTQNLFPRILCPVQTDVHRNETRDNLLYRDRGPSCKTRNCKALPSAEEKVPPNGMRMLAGRVFAKETRGTRRCTTSKPLRTRIACIAQDACLKKEDQRIISFPLRAPGAPRVVRPRVRALLCNDMARGRGAGRTGRLVAVRGGRKSNPASCFLFGMQREALRTTPSCQSLANTQRVFGGARRVHLRWSSTPPLSLSDAHNALNRTP